ncbi:hypothetical protein [Leptothoe sp. PORK10 BA2]|uniref:hypothetical protein n=1 Tax=Leptothoe sp. PORK10 BA2 TaxID=3110254 RepID=UPI002B1EEC05|nr:hypothetical protein [Leptothoe sp. PORK10 BA2]MEA5462438.1 hypothetical protein [Leptothoe sp. PORK10 BA2]
MKVNYLAAVAAASVLSLGVLTGCGGGAADPCAADPCAAPAGEVAPDAADPCAADPCAADPCAGG